MTKKLADKKKREPYKRKKLRFTDEQGVEFEEYIPPLYSKFGYWWRWVHVKARKKFNVDIYYWHIRHSYDPKDRKYLDVQFVNHFLFDHYQKPTDPIEKRHYRRAWARYGREINCVAGELSKDRSTRWGDEGPKKGHPDAYRYTKLWFNPPYEAEWKLLFHGVSLNQYGDILILLRERGRQRKTIYREEHKLKSKPKKK